MKGKLYLFGGASSPDAGECLPGVYSFDIGEDVIEGGGKEEHDQLGLCLGFVVVVALALHYSDGISIFQQCL